MYNSSYFRKAHNQNRVVYMLLYMLLLLDLLAFIGMI